MKPTHISRSSLIFIATLLSACGGGGGGGGAGPSAANSVPVNTTIKAATAAQNFSFSTFKTKALKSSALLAAATGFAVKNPSKTYIKSWYVDVSNQRQQVMFVTLAALQARESAGGIEIQLPGDVTVLKFEIYDSSSNQSGEVLV